jgi:MbtH protein
VSQYAEYADAKHEHCVVINEEEQYSVWPVDRDLPLGWTTIGFTGSRAECLDHIRDVWTDIRPRSVRDRG